MLETNEALNFILNWIIYAAIIYASLWALYGVLFVGVFATMLVKLVVWGETTSSYTGYEFLNAEGLAKENNNGLPSQG